METAKEYGHILQQHIHNEGKALIRLRQRQRYLKQAAQKVCQADCRYRISARVWQARLFLPALKYFFAYGTIGFYHGSGQRILGVFPGFIYITVIKFINKPFQVIPDPFYIV